MLPLPRIEQHGKILVARDDELPGGTKQRFLAEIMAGKREVVYAGPPWGGAAVGIAYVAREQGTKATLFYAARAQESPRQRLARSYGARLELVRPGYLSVVKARAQEYCSRTGAVLLAWGIPQAERAITETAKALDLDPPEVWCAAGSGTLLRGLARAFPQAQVIGVQVGHALTETERTGAFRVIAHPLEFEKRTAQAVPFPSCRHYDAKAWQYASRLAKSGALFWNVMQDHV
jgi:cysteine synthase